MVEVVERIVRTLCAPLEALDDPLVEVGPELETSLDERLDRYILAWARGEKTTNGLVPTSAMVTGVWIALAMVRFEAVERELRRAVVVALSERGVEAFESEIVPVSRLLARRTWDWPLALDVMRSRTYDLFGEYPERP